jgi:hypothetical protein
MYIGSDCHLQNLPAKNTVNSKVFQSIKGKEDTAPYKTGTILTLQYMTLKKGGGGHLARKWGAGVIMIVLKGNYYGIVSIST